MIFRWREPWRFVGPGPWGYFAPFRACFYETAPLRVIPPALPWGWRFLRDPSRCGGWVLPLWLYWPVVAVMYRWWVLEPLVRLGVLRIREGDYWHNARPWFWNAEREAGWRWVKTGAWT